MSNRVEFDIEKGRVFQVTVTVADMRQCLMDFADWMRSRGIDVKGTRIDLYRKHLDDVLGPKNADLSLSVYYECWEIKCIFDGLRTWAGAPYSLESKLDRLRKGHPDIDQEKDTRPRDTAFELFLTAALRERGFSPSFEDEQLEDVGIEFEGRRVRFQCKRIQREQNIQKRLSEAADQLAQISDASTLKVAAVDISKAGNTHRLSSDSAIEASNLVDQEIDVWYENHIVSTRWFENHRHVSGILFKNTALNVRSDGRIQYLYMLGFGALNEHKHAPEMHRLHRATIGR